MSALPSLTASTETRERIEGQWATFRPNNKKAQAASVLSTSDTHVEGARAGKSVPSVMFFAGGEGRISCVATGDTEIAVKPAEGGWSHPVDIRDAIHSYSSWLRLEHIAAAVPKRSQPSMQDRLDATLLSYLALPEGWDGYQGSPVPQEAVEDAMFFASLRPADIRIPYAQVSSTGEVGLYWREEGVHAEVFFEGNGTYYYYASWTDADGNEIERYKDDCKISDGWSEGLLEVLGNLNTPIAWLIVKK